MWSFYFNHGSQWIIDNLFKEGFISEYFGRGKLKWHIINKTPEKIEGYFQNEDGKPIVKHVILLENNEIVRVGFYDPSTGKSYWIYKWRRVNENLLEVERENVKGEKIVYTVEATRNDADKAVSCLVQFPNLLQIVTLEYNPNGLLIRENISCPKDPQEEGVLEYEYDDGNIVAQKAFCKNR
ncbi:hypothetical protein A3G55_01110 [Candidatus Giovannonibacteria bacterium RIFCSPLOWO2_12_FULL_44_25]|uniref:Uncharacterized protein n=3 Tax=Candidatus Giovannoniibacteriota TaxID=1752738 RepID=A0A0G1KJ39_9BACT|nr:MAG: hypothetical protein UW15_C0018G0013 [Parcubacteria group bacterium GW2011_GWC1_44_10]KKT56312.1 MAG: hypothetical protein UW49_C0015G0002 [Candidatus Giovannonibacteria bacterium GW2011_GWB1_44_23]KKT59329.1 MAG: hypothetical protein UW53_C0015G0012 [Candidatus Giovannonibacteria bacterium GW2011_GWA1_44_25]OGF49478.1 MAG: hypothetical protein A2120_03140 [Candidatus Giovannonibacteria bacterium GWA2_45_15]OGF59429.1 MAG: hypothetical protein A2W40_00730 [Candidatus Giovannonibacteria 